jgi:hypothetical protein
MLKQDQPWIQKITTANPNANYTHLKTGWLERMFNFNKLALRFQHVFRSASDMQGIAFG